MSLDIINKIKEHQEATTRVSELKKDIRDRLTAYLIALNEKLIGSEEVVFHNPKELLKSCGAEYHDLTYRYKRPSTEKCPYSVTLRKDEVIKEKRGIRSSPEPLENFLADFGTYNQISINAVRTALADIRKSPIDKRVSLKDVERNYELYKELSEDRKHRKTVMKTIFELIRSERVLEELSKKTVEEKTVSLEERIRTTALKIVEEKGFVSSGDIANELNINSKTPAAYLRHNHPYWGLKKERKGGAPSYVIDEENPPFGKLLEKTREMEPPTEVRIPERISEKPSESTLEEQEPILVKSESLTKQMSEYPAIERWTRRMKFYADKTLSKAKGTCDNCKEPYHINPMITCVNNCKTWFDKRRSRNILSLFYVKN